MSLAYILEVGKTSILSHNIGLASTRDAIHRQVTQIVKRLKGIQLPFFTFSPNPFISINSTEYIIFTSISLAFVALRVLLQFTCE